MYTQYMCTLQVHLSTMLWLYTIYNDGVNPLTKGNTLLEFYNETN